MEHEAECGCGHGQEQHGPGGMHGMGMGGHGPGRWLHHGGWGRMPHGGCDCGCGCGSHHGGGMHHGGGFGPMGHRRFISRAEIIARLEEYQKQLQAEARGVEEHIAELKKEGSTEK